MTRSGVPAVPSLRKGTRQMFESRIAREKTTLSPPGETAGYAAPSGTMGRLRRMAPCDGGILHRRNGPAYQTPEVYTNSRPPGNQAGVAFQAFVVVSRSGSPDTRSSGVSATRYNSLVVRPEARLKINVRPSGET